MDPKDKVLQLVRVRGPVIPSQIYKEINTNILMASAVLSEMVSKNLLKISSVKIGGSPLYYAPGQEARLQEYINKLHEKEKQACDLLREKRVLRDKSLEPVMRVALRQIKDFARPLEVTVGDEKEIFWKWYLLSTEETEPLIKEQLGIVEEKKAETKAEAKKEKLAEKKPEKAFIDKTADTFAKKVLDYFKKNNIQVLEQKTVKKKSETDFIIKVPSAVGELQYYCKAKNKKRNNDADLSSAFVQGQSKKLPVLFLTTGDITKKAREMLSKEFVNITVKKI
jgi:hypothetical protein